MALLIGGLGKLFPTPRQGNRACRLEKPLSRQYFFRWRHSARVAQFLAVEFIDKPLRFWRRRIGRRVLPWRIRIGISWHRKNISTLFGHSKPGPRSLMRQ